MTSPEKSIHEELGEKSLNLKTMALFRERLAPYMRRYRALVVGSIAAVLVSTVAALAAPWLLGYAVDHVLVPREARLLLGFAFLFIGLDLVRAIAMVLQNYLLTLLGQNVLHDLRQDLLRQYQFYPLAEFNRTPTGRLVTRLVNDTASLQDLFTGGFAVALGEVAFVIGIIVWLVCLHPTLGLICVSLFPAMIVVARRLSREIRATYRESRATLSKLNADLAENISGMGLIQVFNKQGYFRERFDRVSRLFTTISIRNVRAFAYLQPSVTVLSSLSMSLLIWYGGYCRMNGTVTLGLLVAFMGYLQALYAPIRDITEKYNLFVSAMTSCERIFEFMDRAREPGTDAASPGFPTLEAKGRIEFRSVWFRYDPSLPWILKDISFTIAPGERIGLVGHTGAGKTTISALLMRFYEIERGQILLDGVDVRELDKRSLRSALGYIQQEAFIFSGTAEENILLWQPHRRETLQALPPSALAGLSVASLSLEKRLYEKGTNLSAGERQVIAFLRALAQSPRVLILDEATAHVDSLTEQWVADASRDAFASRTVLIIAHRLATLKTVDRVLVLHHGELIESGTHDELLARKGVYHKLYEIQARRDALEAAANPPETAQGETDPCLPPL